MAAKRPKGTPSRPNHFALLLKRHDYSAFLNMPMVSYKMKLNTKVLYIKHPWWHDSKPQTMLITSQWFHISQMWRDWDYLHMHSMVSGRTLLRIFEIWAWIANRFYVHSFGEGSKLSVITSVFCFFVCLLWSFFLFFFFLNCYVISHDVCRILKSPWGRISLR